MRLQAIITCLLLVGTLSAHSGAQTVDFENLTNGSLNGQDGWVSNTNDLTVSATTILGTPTKLISSPGAGGWAQRSRGITPTVQNAEVMQFDVTLNGHTNSAGLYGLATSGFSTPVMFGLHADSSYAFYVYLQSSLYAPEGHELKSFLGGYAAFDWFRLKFVTDYSANGGNGSGSLYEMDLTNHDAVFTPVAGLQNLNLGLLEPALASEQPSDLTGQQIYVVGGDSVDNLTTSLDLASTPEPGVVAIGASALFAVVALRRRRKASYASVSSASDCPIPGI